MAFHEFQDNLVVEIATEPRPLRNYSAMFHGPNKFSETVIRPSNEDRLKAQREIYAAAQHSYNHVMRGDDHSVDYFQFKEVTLARLGYMCVNYDPDAITKEYVTFDNPDKSYFLTYSFDKSSDAKFLVVTIPASGGERSHLADLIEFWWTGIGAGMGTNSSISPLEDQTNWFTTLIRPIITEDTDQFSPRLYLIAPAGIVRDPEIWESIAGQAPPKGNPFLQKITSTGHYDDAINRTSLNKAGVFYVPIKVNSFTEDEFSDYWLRLLAAKTSELFQISRNDPLQSAESSVGNVGTTSTSTTIHVHPGASVAGNIDASNVIAKHGSSVQKLVNTVKKAQGKLTNESAYKPNGDANNAVTEAVIAVVATAVVGGVIAAIM